MASLKEVMMEKPEDGLMDYLNNFHKYTPEAITAAVDELKNRGRIFSEAEQAEIQVKVQSRIKAQNEEEELFTQSEAWKQNIVTDPNAPLLYSKNTIRIFSLLFSTIFGAVLLTFNISDTKRKVIVMVFGIIYTTITIITLNLMPSYSYWALMFSGAGGLALTSTFWDKYIGKETQYRAKPIWGALIISFSIAITILLVIIYRRP